MIGQTKCFVNHSWQEGLCSAYEFTLKPEIYICFPDYFFIFYQSLNNNLSRYDRNDENEIFDLQCNPQGTR